MSGPGCLETGGSKRYSTTKSIATLARDWKDVMWALSTRMDPARDITVIENTPIDYLDFASPESGLGSKIGLDATNKLPPETKREWGRKIAMDQSVVEKVTEMWARLGL